MSGCLHIERPLGDSAGVRFEVRGDDTSRVRIGRVGEIPTWLTLDEARQLQAKLAEFFTWCEPREAER